MEFRLAIISSPLTASRFRDRLWGRFGNAEGTPGQERKLSIERGGRQFNVAATVQHFWGNAGRKRKEKK